MGGGLLQLVATGAQDLYLTGNPQITFFKIVYRRHTNFSVECIEQTIDGIIDATPSSSIVTISRNGDLVSSMHLEVTFAAGIRGDTATTRSTQWTNNTGHAFIKEVEVEIGGQRIDKQNGQWLDIWNELTDHEEIEHLGLNKHKSKKAYLLNGASGTNSMDALKVYVPLKFWFNRNPGLALPLIALQYHEVKIKLKTRGVLGLVNSTGTLAGTAAKPNVKLWADYIYLDMDERKRFAQQSHEYLIEQVQKHESQMEASKEMDFNHPIKELIWVIQDATVRSENISGTASDVNATQNIVDLSTESTTNKNDYFNYTTNINDDSEFISNQTSIESFKTVVLTLNGHERFKARDASYFRLIQPAQAGHRIPDKHIYMYSFALRPEQHQPSGSCNFSKMDTAILEFTTAGTFSGTTITIYAVNYNVLKIASGMGGLAYAN